MTEGEGKYEARNEEGRRGQKMKRKRWNRNWRRNLEEDTKDKTRAPSANLKKQLITWYYAVTHPDWNSDDNISNFYRTGRTILVRQPKWKTHCAVSSLIGSTTNPLTQLTILLSTPKRLKHKLQSAGIIHSWDISLLNRQTHTVHLKPHQEHCERHICGRTP